MLSLAGCKLVINTPKVTKLPTHTRPTALRLPAVILLPFLIKNLPIRLPAPTNWHLIA